MRYFVISIGSIITFFCNSLFSQIDTNNGNVSHLSSSVQQDLIFRKKGDFYLYWGYNISWYKKSDIHFYGQGHNFVLYDVVGSDRPTTNLLTYIDPTKWSVPQFDFRIGYFLNNKYSISVGWDHMKWVADDNQSVKMYGYIDATNVADPLMAGNMKATNGGKIAKTYNGETVVLGNNNNTLLQHYEHTDGLNYGSIDIERYDDIWKPQRFKKIAFTIMTGLGAGIVVPRTDATLFGSGENHFWNIAGYGVNGKVGLQLYLGKYIYLRTDFKLGYIDLFNIHTTSHHEIDKAQQSILFYENDWVIGVRLYRKKNKNS